MDINHFSTGKKSQSQIVWSLDDLQSSSPSKSYTCTFCNRGFSNAQALGGHMNIHRKDRARLKQASDESLLSLDISTNPIDHPQVSEDKNICLLDSSEDRSRAPTGSCSLSIEDNASTPRIKDSCEEFQQLPFFVDKNPSTNFPVSVEEDEKKVELDLELRLGPEPREKSASNRTREFL